MLMPKSLDGHKGIALTLSTNDVVADIARAEREFRRVFDDLYEEAHAYAEGFVGTGLADDVVQDAFVGLWEATYARDKPPRDFRAMLFGVIRRRIVDVARQRDRDEEKDDREVFDIAARLEVASATSHAADGNL